MDEAGTEGGKRLTKEARAILKEIDNKFFPSERARRYSKPVKMLRRALEEDPALVKIFISGLRATVDGLSRDVDAFGIEGALKRIRRDSVVTGRGADNILVSYIGLKELEESMKHRRGKVVVTSAVKAQQQKAAPEKQQEQKPKQKPHHAPRITEAWLARSAHYMDYDWLKLTLDRRLSDEYRKKLLTNTLTPEEALSVYSLFLTAWADSVPQSSLPKSESESMQELSREIKNISDIDTAVIAGRKALRLYALAMSSEEMLACNLNRQEREFIRFVPSEDSQLLGNAHLWDHIYTMLLISAERVERKIGLPPYTLDIAEEKVNGGGSAEIYKVNQRHEVKAR